MELQGQINMCKFLSLLPWCQVEGQHVQKDGKQMVVPWGSAGAALTMACQAKFALTPPSPSTARSPMTNGHRAVPLLASRVPQLQCKALVVHHQGFHPKIHS
jgi:hypothetical protein